jgi:aminoglycoside phosphotransferase family enzyme
VIAKAESVFPQFRKLKMQRKREMANRVMHDYENQADMQDQSVIEFLKTLQAVVRDIPK